MSKYQALNKDVFSIFGSVAWKALNIKTFPDNHKADAAEYIRISILPNGAGINLSSISGILIIDIFTSAGAGPRRASFIADSLDSFLVGKSVETSEGHVTQFINSAFMPRGLDRDNPTLYRSSYTIPFNYFGVLD